VNEKVVSLWLVSFYAEFIALLLNSLLGLLFWPSLKRGGEVYDLFLQPSALFLGFRCLWRGIPHVGFLAEENFPDKLLVALLS
jgi:hypothetical protein